MWKMKLDICLTEDTLHNIIVTEITDGNQYLAEGSALTAKNRFAVSDTASIDIFKLNSIEKDAYTSSVITMRDKSILPVEVKLTRDGWFTAIHIVIPTLSWAHKELSKQGSIINVYRVVYCTDGDKIYKVVNGRILNSNINELLAEQLENTTISRQDSDYVYIGNLTDTLNKAWIELFKNRIYNSGCHTDACAANRLLAIVNLIKHNVRHAQLAEAERVIEKTNYFQDIKGLENMTPDQILYNKTGGCGCHHGCNCQ